MVRGSSNVSKYIQRGHIFGLTYIWVRKIFHLENQIFDFNFPKYSRISMFEKFLNIDGCHDMNIQDIRWCHGR